MIETMVSCCVCGCHMVKFVKFEDETTVWMEVYENAYYAKRESKFLRYLRRLWSAVCGKEYRLFEIVLSPEDAKGIRDALVTMTEAE